MPPFENIFSVVIPTQNTRAAFLNECLGSIERQTLQPKEVIVVNNGFRGLRIPQSSIPVRVIDTVMGAGVAQARNLGCTVATTPYVAFVDDDDLLAGDYLERMYFRVKTSSPDCLVGRLDELVEGRVSEFKDAQFSLSIGEILVRNPGITGSNTVVRKDAFLQVGGYRQALSPSEDKALVLEMLVSGFVVVAAPECQAIIRQHSGERLSTFARLATGTLAFSWHYRPMMTLSQKIASLIKVARYLILSHRSRD